MALIPSFLLYAAEPTASIPPTPQFRIEETLVSYRGSDSWDYLAFPAIVQSGDQEILLSYKRGKSHARDLGAVLEIQRVNLKTGRMIQKPIQLGLPGEIMQMGEWIRFPNGTLGTYIDAQVVDDENKHERTGLLRAVSRDNGKSFGPLERVGIIDGVEYGYLFDTATVGKRLYALIMTFEYLAGGRRSVDALHTDDNGKTWHFIRNLSQEFGDIRINESSLIPYEKGFIVATRGYDNMQRLHQVDAEFKRIKEINLTEKTTSIDSYIGRPRLFTCEGAYFLTGRNWRAVDRSIPMELALIRFDPKSLEVEKLFVIDNEEQGKVTDGYYPCPILAKAGDRTLLNIFDYRAILGNPPDIIRLQFDSAAFLP
ncbi:MAG: sialidase family protein [Verrucomicrobia bacterium]|nr:sialidase family protein [Verrucomicrobiota bacterium]